MPRELYEILGVRPTTSPDGIKRAYRRLVKRYHPDVNKQRGAKEIFLEVKEAYEVLSNPLLRREYDERTARETGAPGPVPRPTKPGAPRKVRIPAEYVRVASPFRSYRDRIERVKDRQIERRTRTAKTVWRLYVVTVASMSGSLMVFAGFLLSAGGMFQGAITLTAGVMMLVLLLIAWVAKGMIAPDL
ncbi:MAG TPA: J domain-containing protein [Thermoplasmata archaeon]|nr:J domain-containing protein [Thermoplasmata archaeon]